MRMERSKTRDSKNGFDKGRLYQIAALAVWSGRPLLILYRPKLVGNWANLDNKPLGFLFFFFSFPFRLRLNWTLPSDTIPFSTLPHWFGCSVHYKSAPPTPSFTLQGFVRHRLFAVVPRFFFFFFLFLFALHFNLDINSYTINHFNSDETHVVGRSLSMRCIRKQLVVAKQKE